MEIGSSSDLKLHPLVEEMASQGGENLPRVLIDFGALGDLSLAQNSVCFR